MKALNLWCQVSPTKMGLAQVGLPWHRLSTAKACASLIRVLCRWSFPSHVSCKEDWESNSSFVTCCSGRYRRMGMKSRRYRCGIFVVVETTSGLINFAYVPSSEQFHSSPSNIHKVRERSSSYVCTQETGTMWKACGISFAMAPEIGSCSVISKKPVGLESQECRSFQTCLEGLGLISKWLKTPESFWAEKRPDQI